MKKYIKQKDRLYVMLFYIVILFLINYIVFERLLPLSGAKGLWFYSGLASILLGDFLVTPFYTKPVDAISYSLLSMIAIYSLNNWGEWVIIDKSVFIFSLLFCLLVLMFSFASIILKDSDNINSQKWSKTLKIIVDDFGNQNFIFSIVILYSLIVFHRNSAKEMFLLSLAWIITVVIKPDKYLFNLYDKIKGLWKIKQIKGCIGNIKAYQEPGIILIEQNSNDKINFGTKIIFKDNFNKLNYGFILDYKSKNNNKLLRAITYNNEIKHTDNKEEIKEIPNNKIFKYDNFYIKDQSEIEDFVGLVSANTDIEYLKFEVIREQELEEGRLVQVMIKDKPVLYQIINGLTQEEIIYQKNKNGYAIGKARKVGIWNDRKKKFKPAKWIPKINTPVYLKINDEYEPEINTIGHFPGSNYNVGIKNINDLVTHNTAVIGILGIGKSMLSIELIERMINEKIKVVCLDLTNQYMKELRDFYDKETEEEKIKEIQEAGQKDKDAWAENPENGGSVPNLTEAIFSDLKEFIDNDNYLKIYNPSELFATKQTSEPRNFNTDGNWQRGASLWSVTPVEITKIISEQLLELVNDKMSSKAKVCIILEEAHALVPEFHTVVQESDKRATNATARVILQGRKYGLGCLLISQRTANVTKTILNQCNTIFAMRTFDDTGKGFLSNYIGNEYSEILSSLKERQAIFYGKASSCENPVILRLNDQDEFRNIFRQR